MSTACPVQALIFFLYFSTSESKFLILVDENSENWIGAFRIGSSEYDEQSGGHSFEFRSVTYLNDSSWNEVCQGISAGGVSAVLDITHQLQPDFKPEEFFTSKSIPYYKVEVPTDLLIKGANALMEAKSASNGFLIFHGDNDVGRGIHLILGNTLIRYAFLNADTMGKLIMEKFDYRIPSGVLLFGTGQQFESFVKERSKVIRNLTDWIFSFDSFQPILPSLNISFQYIRGYFDEGFCCRVLSMRVGINPQQTPTSSCTPADCVGDPTELYLKKLAFIFSDALKELDGKVAKVGCAPGDAGQGDPKFVSDFSKKLEEKSGGLYKLDNTKLTLGSTVKYDEAYQGNSTPIGSYSVTTGFTRSPQFEFRKRPLYYRIGIVDFKPWTYKDNGTGEWVGYCIDLAKKIAERMNFTYDFVATTSFGNRNNITGRWNGITGDLVHGKIDIAIAAYIMTSEREEYIDFVYKQIGQDPSFKLDDDE